MGRVWRIVARAQSTGAYFPLGGAYVSAYVWSARISLADPVGWKELTLLIARSTGSRASVGRSNPSGEASRGEPVSRNAGEPVSA